MRLLTVGQHEAYKHNLSLITSVSYEDAEDAEDALSILGLNYEFDGVIFHTNVNHLFVSEVRRKGIKLPIIITTNKCESLFRVNALNRGADLVLVLPIDSSEYSAYVIATIRRSKGQASHVIQIGEIEYNTSTQEISANGHYAHLTGHEAILFEAVVYRDGGLVTPDQLMERLYPLDKQPEEKILQVYLCKIRKKLERIGHPGLIGTNWGRGIYLDLKNAKTSHHERRSAA